MSITIDILILYSSSRWARHGVYIMILKSEFMFYLRLVETCQSSVHNWWKRSRTIEKYVRTDETYLCNHVWNYIKSCNVWIAFSDQYSMKTFHDVCYICHCTVLYAKFVVFGYAIFQLTVLVKIYLILFKEIIMWRVSSSCISYCPLHVLMLL